IVSLKKKYGVIDNQGKEIIPLLYQKILKCPDGYFFVQLKGKWGIIDENGKEILPCIYKDLKYNEGMFCVKEKKLWGVISVR
ncbi:MAG: WG repeat-containing protein, partial [Bacteroidales bacterium]|nr:WG repeat-containing protein [Bacteroidales bacterium]